MELRTDRGITLIETSILVATFAVLSAMLAPVAARIVDSVRITRAIEDVKAIKTAIQNFQSDVNNQGFDTNPQGAPATNKPVEVAVSDGDTPTASLADDNGALAGAQMRWDDPVQNVTGFTIVDFLERHLVTNNPFGNPGYSTTTGNIWRGTYIDAPIGPDPWGNRYAVNIKFVQAPATTTNDVVVLSAGPDEEIDSLFEADGIAPGDDDIMAVIIRNRNTPVP